MRYKEGKDLIQEKIIKAFERVDEAQMNNRFYHYARVESCLLPMYRLFCKETKPVEPLYEDTGLTEEEIQERDKLTQQREYSRDILKTEDRKFTWKNIKEGLEIKEEVNTDDEEHARRIHKIID